MRNAEPDSIVTEAPLCRATAAASPSVSRKPLRHSSNGPADVRLRGREGGREEDFARISGAGAARGVTVGDGV